jgi:hypothetical protein
MESKANEVRQIAGKLLASMLANPHIYSMVSDEGARGKQEQELILVAIEIAESLIAKVDKKYE